MSEHANLITDKVIGDYNEIWLDLGFVNLKAVSTLTTARCWVSRSIPDFTEKLDFVAEFEKLDRDSDGKQNN